MDMLKMQKIVLLYMTDNNYDILKLEQNFITADAAQTGDLPYEQFQQCCQ